ncbi:hypothetical protein PHISP_08640, partial [Aspergillus sp. HF37]
LHLPGHRILVGHPPARLGLCHRDPGADPVGADAGRDGSVPVQRDPPAGEFRGRHELRDLPDVLCLVRAVPAVADARKQPAVARHLRRQSLHPRGRADPVCAVHAGELDRPGGGPR